MTINGTAIGFVPNKSQLTVAAPLAPETIEFVPNHDCDPCDSPSNFESLCTSPEKTDTEIWLTNTVSGLIRTLHFVQGRNPA